MNGFNLSSVKIGVHLNFAGLFHCRGNPPVVALLTENEIALDILCNIISSRVVGSRC